MTSQTPGTPFLTVRPQTFRTTLFALFALIAISAIQIGAPQWLGQDPGAIDYKIFHYVGQLSRQGSAALPYDAEAFEAWQAAQPGGEIFMPWTYPPQFALLTALLSMLPTGIGYLVFTGASLAVLVWALFRLAPATATPALMLCLPAVVMNIRAGQNGFVSAILFSLVCLLALRQRPALAGVPLGLLAYKPHLGLGLGLVALVRGGIGMVLVAIGVVGLALGLASWIFGLGIWSAFLTSLRDSSSFLVQGAYPLHRMISAYALLASLGVPSQLAMLGQFAVAVACLGSVGLALLRRWPLAPLLALSCIAGLGLSPYGYDYDLVALLPGLALALPTLARGCSRRCRLILIVSLLIATGWGLVTVLLTVPLASAGLAHPPAIGALGFLVALALIVRTLFRAEAHGTA